MLVHTTILPWKDSDPEGLSLNPSCVLCCFWPQNADAKEAQKAAKAAAKAAADQAKLDRKEAREDRAAAALEWNMAHNGPCPQCDVGYRKVILSKKQVLWCVCSRDKQSCNWIERFRPLDHPEVPRYLRRQLPRTHPLAMW